MAGSTLGMASVRITPTALLKLLAITISMVSIFVLFGGSASALSSSEPQGSARFGVGGIGGQFNTSVTVSRYYVPGAAAGGIIIESTNYWNIGDVSVYTVSAGNVCQVNPANRVGYVDPGGTNSGIGGIGGGTFTVGGYRVYCVVTTSGSASVARFKIHTSAGHLIGNDVSLNAGTTGYVGSDNPVQGGPTWSRDMYFAPNCDVGRSGNTYPGAGASVEFYDLDLNQPWQPPMTMYVQQTPPFQDYGGGLSNMPGTPQTYSSGVENEYKSSGNLTFNSGGPRKYRMLLTPIASNNALKIALPYDQIYTIIPCPPLNTPPNGWFSITCNPDTAVLTVIANTADAENPNVRVDATVSGIGNRTVNGAGSFSMGTFGGWHGGTFTVSGTVTDVGGLSSAMIQDTVSCPTAIWITGAVRNAYSPGSGYGGVQITTCRPAGSLDGPTATTDAAGNFAFRVPQGRGFCVRLSTNPAGSLDRRVRPRLEGYNGCAAYGLSAPYPTPNYCAAFQSYESQVAGGAYGGIDRAQNGGYDIALRFRPQITCSLTGPSVIEVGQPFRPTVDVRNTAGSTRPPVSGTVTLVVTGQPNRSSPYGPLAAGQDTNPDVSFTDVVINAAGTYTFSATATGTGDGFSIDPTPRNCGSDSVLVAQMSYLKSYGGDAWAGASFADPCAFTSGSIDTFAAQRGTSPINGAPTYVGSSSQFSITALMTVNEFYSASNRMPGGGNTFPPKGMTFSNNGAGTPGSTYGGGYGAAYPRCLPDYHTDGRGTNVQSVGTVTNANFTGGPLQFDLGNGNHTLGSLTIPNGNQVVVFAEGNVYLNGQIGFSGAPRASIADIPNFTLIVEGNIYVDNDVTRLDGLYIAQPHGGAQATEGRFYTCARQLTPPRLYTGAQLFANCGGQAGVSGQLRINGGVIAQQVRFLRTFGSLRDATVTEAPNFADGTGTNAGEIFNYTPEMFLAPSGLERPRQAGSYDAITSLPPVY